MMTDRIDNLSLHFMHIRQRRISFFKFNKKAGFTLIELIFAIFLASSALFMASEILVDQVQAFEFVSKRRHASGAARQAMDRLTHDLLRVETADIQSINENGISIVDSEGQNVTYEIVNQNGTQSLYRGSDEVVPNFENFELEYRDEDGNVLSPDDSSIANVRRIGIRMTTSATANEGSVEMATTIVPRSFIGYQNYQ